MMTKSNGTLLIIDDASKNQTIVKVFVRPKYCAVTGFTFPTNKECKLRLAAVNYINKLIISALDMIRVLMQLEAIYCNNGKVKNKTDYVDCGL